VGKSVSWCWQKPRSLAMLGMTRDDKRGYEVASATRDLEPVGQGVQAVEAEQGE
jgi:hypothetical protein